MCIVFILVNFVRQVMTMHVTVSTRRSEVLEQIERFAFKIWLISY